MSSRRSGSARASSKRKDKPVFDEVILHIGAEKTGTTSIQSFLASNREQLLHQGVFYPASVGAANHVAMAMLAADDSRQVVNKVRSSHALFDDTESLRQHFRHALTDELASAQSSIPSGVKRRVLFSAEHFHSQLQTEEEIGRLKALVPAAQSYRVIFYVRRQDLAAASLRSTGVKAGGSARQFGMRTYREVPYRFDYLKSWRRWASIFGAESIALRVFDRGEFFEGDLLKDFCRAVGLSWQDNFNLPPRENRSLDANGEYVFERLNSLTKAPDFIAKPGRLNKLKQNLSDIFTDGGRASQSSAEARAFQLQFAVANEQLRSLACPARTVPLFHDDFSMYPDTAVDSEALLNRDLIVDRLLGLLLSR